MSILIALIMGGLVGWAAAALLGRNEGVVASVIIGIIGSVLGSFVSTLFTGGDRAALDLSLSGLIWSFIGAVILVALLNAFRGRQGHNTV